MPADGSSSRGRIAAPRQSRFRSGRASSFLPRNSAERSFKRSSDDRAPHHPTTPQKSRARSASRLFGGTPSLARLAGASLGALRSRPSLRAPPPAPRHPTRHPPQPRLHPRTSRAPSYKDSARKRSSTVVPGRPRSDSARLRLGTSSSCSTRPFAIPPGSRPWDIAPVRPASATEPSRIPLRGSRALGSRSPLAVGRRLRETSRASPPAVTPCTACRRELPRLASWPPERRPARLVRLDAEPP